MSLALAIVLAASLPTFEDFREADRARRESRQWQTGTAARLMQVEPGRVLDVAKKRRDDWELQWGAAELLTDWKQKRPHFEAALAASGTNSAIALRFACAAATERQDKLAQQWLEWLEYCQRHDKSNNVPWLVELWLLRAQGGADRFKPTSAGSMFRDCSGDAARAQIRMLETIGYSKYAARRIGFLPKLYAVQMAQELRRGQHAEHVQKFLLDVAKAMQSSPTFLVAELAGQSLESAMWERQKDSALKMARLDDLAARRSALGDLIQEMERRVDAATEERMVNYYDDLLLLGEIEAMRRLGRDLGPLPK
jgi:hypothetical protein